MNQASTNSWSGITAGDSSTQYNAPVHNNYFINRDEHSLASEQGAHLDGKNDASVFCKQHH